MGLDGKYGKLNVNGLKKLQKKLNNLADTDQFFVRCDRILAARLLSKTIKRTPVGDYTTEVDAVAKRDSKYHKKGDVYKKRVNKSGRRGGTLRRGWTSKTKEEAESGKRSPQIDEIIDFVNKLEVTHSDGKYRIDIINPVPYAAYVEYGHRTPNKKGWVKGRFMLTKSKKELQIIAPKILEKELKKHIERTLR